MPAISADIQASLNQQYSRISRNVDFTRMLNSHCAFAGVGGAGNLVEALVRQGLKSITLIDPDWVERKNLVAQNFIHYDLGKPKVIALAERLAMVEFEHRNPEVPPLDVLPIHGDFRNVSEKALLRRGHTNILIMATDFHPAQARGNLIALHNEITTFWVGIYPGGRAGEIIFYRPGFDLPCYRCIVQSRYEAFDQRLREGKVTQAISSGLPLAALFIDSILGHLIIGAIHLDDMHNPHGALVRRLLHEKRNFIQMQLDPDYRLAGEDIFAEFNGPNSICFNTLFQTDSRNPECPDCRT